MTLQILASCCMWVFGSDCCAVAGGTRAGFFDEGPAAKNSQFLGEANKCCCRSETEPKDSEKSVKTLRPLRY